MLTKKRESHCNDSGTFTEYPNDKNICIFLLIVFDMIANVISYKIVTELFITGTKLNSSLVFITQSNFAVPIDITLNFTHFFYYEGSKQARAYRLSDIDFKDFKKIFQKCTTKLFSLSVNNTILASQIMINVLDVIL